MDSQNGTKDLLEEFAVSIEQLAHTIEALPGLRRKRRKPLPWDIMTGWTESLSVSRYIY